MEKFVSLSEAKAKLNQFVEGIEQKLDEVIVTKNGKPVMVMIPYQNYDGKKETEWIKNNPEFYKEIKRGIARLKKGGKTLSFEDVFGEKL